MANSSSQSSGGIGLCSLVFIVFLVLKLAGIGAVAGWSWWWITAPLWMPLTLFFIGFCIWVAFKLIAE